MSRNGPPEAVRISRCTSRGVRGRAGTGGWRCARCRPAAPRRRARFAAAITTEPAMTRISLFASAIVLPASIAASTASSAAVPDEANSTTSASGCVATSISPCGPLLGRQRRARRPVALAPARRAAPRCRRRRARRRAASCGCASTTASALWPIEPVEPRMAMPFMSAVQLPASSFRLPASSFRSRRRT